MSKFRKKPVVIEAVRASEFAWPQTTMPAWAYDAVSSGKVEIYSEIVVVKTLEGDMSATLDDWIIRGVKGELYPCKPDIFSATYDRVEDEA